MKPGKLRSIIAYLEKQQTIDEYGGPENTWTDFGRIRATVTPLRGKDIEGSGGVFSTAEVKFYHRYFDGINSSMRIRYNGIDYEILGHPVDVWNKRREHEIYAKAVVGGA